MAWIHRLVRLGDLDGVAAELAAGVDVNAAGSRGQTPLIIAAEEGHVEMIALLLRAGADPNLPSRNGRPPLDFAAWKGHVACVRTLAAAGAHFDVKGLRISPLLRAAHCNHAEVVAVLLEFGADPEQRDAEGRTAADWLALGGWPGELEAMMEERLGPKVNGLYAAPANLQELVQRMMAEYSVADEYAAHFARNVGMCSFSRHFFEDPAMHAWAHRFAAILRDEKLLAQCEERYLQAEELADARKHREKLAQWKARRNRSAAGGAP